MSKEQYVTFDVAKLLKEKRFDWSTPKLYGKCRVYNGEPIDFDTECELKDEGKGDKIKDDYALYDMWWVASELDLGYPCPTQQMACRWLREEHKIDVSVTPDDGSWWIRITELESWSSVFNDKVLNSDDIKYAYKGDTSTKEGCYEAALEYCLTNLI